MVTRAAARRRRAIGFGAGVLIFFLALVILSLVSQQGLPFAPRTVVKAAFTDVGSLRAGDDVRIANVRVGYVESIELVHSQNPVTGSSTEPVVTMRLDNDRPVYRNARAVTASVGARSALGQKFVELSPGDPAAGPLPPDMVISAERTLGAQELSDVLAVLDEPTRQAIGSTVRNVGGGLAGRSQDLNEAFDALPHVLPDLGTVSDDLSVAGGRDLAAMLRSTDALARSFTGRQEQLGQLLGKLDKTFAGLNADNGMPLTDTLRTAPDALRQARGALTSLDQPLLDTATAARELGPGGKALGAATPDLRGVLVESRPPLDRVPGVSHDAQPALVDLRDTVADARPLAPQLRDAFGRGGVLAETIGPYSPEISRFFTNATSALRHGNDNYHWLNITTPINPGDIATSLAGGQVRSPLQSRDPYPAPGQSANQYQRAPGPLDHNGVTGR
jgi:phospholipid/cholesterol/gamma-HCH transport system substrate-binding protein